MELDSREEVREAELTRAKNSIESGFLKHLQGVRERASLLNLYEAERGDPGFLARDLNRYREATATGIKDVVAKTLDPKARVILRVVPQGTMKPASSPGKKNAKEAAQLTCAASLNTLQLSCGARAAPS